MKIRLIRDVAWTTTTEVVVTLNSFGLKEEDRVAAFSAVRAIIEDGLKLFEIRRQREQSRLCTSDETQPPPADELPN